MKRTLLLLYCIIILVTSFLISAALPSISISERGNISYDGSVLAAPLNGSVNVTVSSTGKKLSAFELILGDYNLQRHIINPGGVATDTYSYNGSILRFEEKQGIFFKDVQNKTFGVIQLNITSNFEKTIYYTLEKKLDNDCEFAQIFSKFPSSSSIINNTLYYSGAISGNSIAQINISCNLTKPSDKYFTFGSSIYTINSSELISSPLANFLPDSDMSITKKWNNNKYDLTFEFLNKDSVPINLTQVYLWATIKTNSTNITSVDTDKIYNKTLTQFSSTLSENNTYQYSGSFLSNKTPIIWANVSYIPLFTFNLSGLYDYTGIALSKYLGITVTLISPSNLAEVITGNAVTFTYNVNANANCSLYTNFNGNWSIYTNHFNVSGQDSFILNAPTNAIYKWNVYCVDTTNSTEYAFGEHNRTLIVRPVPPVPTPGGSPAGGGGGGGSTIGLELYDINITPGKIVLLPGEIRKQEVTVKNIGAELNNILIVPQPDYMWFDPVIIDRLRFGEEINISLLIKAPLELAEYPFDVFVKSDEIFSYHLTKGLNLEVASKRLAGTIIPDLKIIKRIEKLDSNLYNISIVLVNLMDAEFPSFELRDSMKGLSLIRYGDIFVLDGSWLSLTTLSLPVNGIMKYSYIARNVDMNQVRQPIALTDNKVLTTIEYVYPYTISFDVSLLFNLYIEIGFAIVAILTGIYFYIKYLTLKKLYDNLSKSEIKIIEYLSKKSEPVAIKDLADGVNMTVPHVRKTIKMLRHKDIHHEKGFGLGGREFVRLRRQ